MLHPLPLALFLIISLLPTIHPQYLCPYSFPSLPHILTSSIPTNISIPLSSEGSFLITGSIAGSSYSLKIGLYTNHTIVAKSCLNFSPFTCNRFGTSPCLLSNIPMNPILPYFSVQGWVASANVNFINQGSFLNCLTIANSCSGDPSPNYSNSVDGILGLGIGSYSSTAAFAVSLDTDDYNLVITVPEIPDQTQNLTSGFYFGTLYTTQEWHAIPSDIEIQVMDISIPFTGSAIFDQDAIAIGIPDAIYGEFINGLASAANMQCNPAQLYLPNCTYIGKIEDLPVVKFFIQNTQIDIMQTMYVLGWEYGQTVNKGEYITLNFRSLSSSLEGENYVSPGYENYIIFDQNFLRFYSLLFEYSPINGNYSNPTNCTVSLYMQFPETTTDSTVLELILIVLVVILVVSNIVYCARKRYEERENERRELLLPHPVPPRVSPRRRVQVVNNANVGQRASLAETNVD